MPDDPTRIEPDLALCLERQRQVGVVAVQEIRLAVAANAVPGFGAHEVAAPHDGPRVARLVDTASERPLATTAVGVSRMQRDGGHVGALVQEFERH